MPKVPPALLERLVASAGSKVPRFVTKHPVATATAVQASARAAPHARLIAALAPRGSEEGERKGRS